MLLSSLIGADANAPPGAGNVEVAGIGHDLGESLQLLELIQLCPSFLLRLLNCSAHKYSILQPRTYAATSTTQSKL